eukprot:260941-Chlamydomonas_euryale.AAC.8
MHPQVFISKLHSEADGQGLHSPGPCAYEQDRDIAEVTSKFARAGGSKFSTGDRFKMHSTF